VNIFADENVPRLVVDGLRLAGHNITWGCETDIGASDPNRLHAAFLEKRVILTEDNDFAELVIAQRFTVYGLIRFNLFGMSRENKAARILEGVAEIGSDVTGRIFVIEHSRVRSRLI
jgi:predicted nuclease of predicted toxin-antitoxin system